MPVENRIDPDEIYYLQNNHDGYTTYNHGALNSGEQFKWGGKGNSDADDVQAVPGYILRAPQFQKLLNTGLLSLVENGAEITAMAGQVWLQNNSEEADVISHSLDRDDNETLEEMGCLGPGKKGTNNPCGDKLFMRRKDSETKPPLCSRHERYAAYFERSPEGWERLKPTKV